jgi:hypothetical protein
MFNKNSVVKILNIFSLVSFFLSGIIGFVEVSKKFIPSNLILSLNCIFFPLCIIVYELSYQIPLNIKSLLYFWCAILIMGINHTVLGLSITIIIFSCILFYVYIFSNQQDTEILEEQN